MIEENSSSLSEESLSPSVSDAAASVSLPPTSGYRALLQSLFRGKITGAAVALVIRQAVIMIMSVGSSVAVSRWLGPEIVGRFAILIFITQGILGYFGDMGLKAALIRKRGELEPRNRHFADNHFRNLFCVCGKYRAVSADSPAVSKAGAGKLSACSHVPGIAGGSQSAHGAFGSA